MKPSQVYKVDETATIVKNDLDLVDESKREFRFAETPLSMVIDAINAADERYTTYICAKKSVADAKVEGQAVPPKKLSEELVSGVFSGSIPDIVRDVALTLSCKYSSIGGTKFYIGEVPEDLKVDYIVESDLTDESYKELLAMYERVKAVRVGSRVYLRGDFVEVRDLVNAFRRFDRQGKSYLCNVVFIRSSRSKVNDIKARVEFESIDLISSGYSLLDVFEAYGAIDINGSNSRQYLEQELLTTDGVQSQLSIGNDREQEQRSISDAGTSTVSGYRTINDGVELNITPRASAGGFVDVKLAFTNSKFDNASTFNRYKTDVQYDNLRLELNKVYYIASLEENNNSRTYEFLGFRGSASDEVVTVWLTLTPVQSTMNRENF